MSPRDFTDDSAWSEPSTFWDVLPVVRDTAHVGPSLAIGTMILTANGEMPVEYLQAGDQLMTRDHGLQSIARIDWLMLSDTELRVSPERCPVMITRNALGDGLPCRDLLVAPAQRVSAQHAGIGMTRHNQTFSALDLVGRIQGVFVDESAMASAGVEYFALVLDQPCVIWADDLPVESLGLTARSLRVA